MSLFRCFLMLDEILKLFWSSDVSIALEEAEIAKEISEQAGSN